MKFTGFGVWGPRAGYCAIEKSGESFQMFETLRFIDIKDSFSQNELIGNVIVCFASI